MSVFDEMGVYWAEIADQNQTRRQVPFVKNHVKPEGLVLDLACGTGRHMIPLSVAGYSMVGLDVSPSLLRIAKSRCREAQLVRADMRFLPFKACVFSAAISMDNSFGYLPSEEEDVQSLKDLQRVLSEEGMLVLDVFNRQQLISKYKAEPGQVQREYPSFSLQQERTVTADGKELHDHWAIRDKADGKVRVFEHATRLYTLDSLSGLLEQAGFGIRQVYGDYEMQRYSNNTSRLIIVACSVKKN